MCTSPWLKNPWCLNHFSKYTMIIVSALLKSLVALHLATGPSPKLFPSQGCCNEDFKKSCVQVLNYMAVPGTEQSVNNWVLSPLSSPQYFLASPWFSSLSSPCCFTVRCLYITWFFLLLLFNIYPSKSNSNITFPQKPCLYHKPPVDVFIPFPVCPF